MPSVTHAALKSRVLAQLDNNTAFYPELKVTRAINDGLQQLNLFTGIVQGPVTFTTKVGRHYYYLPDGVITPLAVDLDGKQLRRTSLHNLAARRGRWLRETSANHGTTDVWAPVGSRTIAIHPADSKGGRTLRVVGVLEPTLLVADADVIDIPDEMVDAVEDLAVLGLQLKEGGSIFYQASGKYVEFQKQISEWERWKGIKHPRYTVEKERPKTG
jgi:hypothetical protein